MEKLDKFPFLTKLFQNKKPCRKHHCKWAISNHSKGWSPTNFDRDNVRLVIIQQNQNTYSNTSGGQVLYDSKSEPRPTTNNQDVKKKCLFRSNRNCNRNQQGTDASTPTSRRPRLASDLKSLEEIMFGSAPMVQKGCSLKVHMTEDPPQVMVTKVFLPVSTNKESSMDLESFDLYSVQSISADSTPKQIAGSDRNIPAMIDQSVPVDVPMPTRKHNEDNEDSGISASMASSCSSSFTTSGYSPSSSASMSSVNSRTRRFLRSQTTSFEYSFAKRTSDENGDPLPGSQRPPCLGIGITFTLPQEDTETFRLFESFFFSHITLIESHVVKLRLAVEKALQKRNKHMVTEKHGVPVLEYHLLRRCLFPEKTIIVIETPLALDVFRSAVFDLYTAPRLSEPVWLNMMSYSPHQVSLSHNFLKEFMSIMDKYENKNTKFFVSTLVTAVLTHHLAWVPTVSPAGVTPSRTYLDKHSAKWLDSLAKSHPYNPLWAQLGDLYGAIGFPLRLSRTVILGQKADLVCKLLHVLSYFIRCSDVHERVEHRPCMDDMDGHIDIPGMSTIDEDDISEGGDNTSRRYGSVTYGSATSFGTVRHSSMQASTEMVLSAKSDGTVIDRYMEGRLGSPVNMPDGMDVLSECGPPGVCQGDATEEECTCQENPDGLCTEFCSTCRELRERVEPLCGDDQSTWRYGRSVFYCCTDDVYGTRLDGAHQCNFDLQTYSSCDTVNEAFTSGTNCDNVPSELDISRDVIAIATSKPLVLIRMLSEEPVQEEDICDTSFSHQHEIGECTPVSKTSVVPLVSVGSSKVTDIVDKASPSELFTALHDEALPTLCQPSGDTVQDVTPCGRLPTDVLPSTNVEPSQDEKPSVMKSSTSVATTAQSFKCSKDDHVECKLSSTDSIEKLVRVARTRHVGRVADNKPLSVKLVRHQSVNNPEKIKGTDKSELSVMRVVNDTAKEAVSNIESAQDELCENHVTVTDLSSAQSDCVFPGNETLSPPDKDRDSTCIYGAIDHSTETVMEPNPVQTEETCRGNVRKSLSAKSLSPISEKSESCGSRTSLYPNLYGDPKDVCNMAAFTGSNIQEQSSTNLYPAMSCNLDESLGVGSGYTQCEQARHYAKCDPGAVEMFEADLGTLYPLIIDNTVISPVVKTRGNSQSETSTWEPVVSNTSTIAGNRTRSNQEFEIELPIKQNIEFITGTSTHVTLEDAMETDILVGRASACDVASIADSGIKSMDTTVPLLPVVDQAPAHAKVNAWLRTTSESSSSLSDDDVICSDMCQTCDINQTEPVTSSGMSNINSPQITDKLSDSRMPNGNTDTYNICDNALDQTESKMPKIKSASPAACKLSQRALMDRQDSTFDEYFNDESVDLPTPDELECKDAHQEQQTVFFSDEQTASSTACNKCQRSCSHDSNNSVFLPDNSNTSDFSPSACQKSGPSGRSRSLDVMDGYFTEDLGSVTLPDGPTKDMITSTLSLMQGERHPPEDDVTMADVLDGMVDNNRSRSNSGSSSIRLKSLNRQQSSGSAATIQNSISSSTPARCRTVTPEELNRRRHPSSTSTVSWEIDTPDAKSNMKDVPMLRSISSESGDENSKTYNSTSCNFGHSLLAGYTDHYMSDFVLHGTSDSSPSLLTKLQSDLSITVQNSVLDEPITEACCIVADTDKWLVRLHTCQCSTPDRMRQMDMSASQMVCNILESVHKLWKIKMSPEFCLMHLEDRLQELYFKSKMLSEYILIHRKLDLKELSTTLGFDVSDMPLLLAVAGTHTPNLALSLLN